MRIRILLSALALTVASVAAHADTKKMKLETKGITSFRMDVAAGDLYIEGAAGDGEIEVVARLSGDERDHTITLTREGDRAVLIADSENFLWFGLDSQIDLRIKVPHGLKLDIRDGSGDIRIVNTVGATRINDGSGSIEVANLRGSLDVDDGSGSIDISGVVGDIFIEDGSGSMTIADVDGKVVVDDGSGSISVENVTENLDIVDDGSGEVYTRNIKGGVDRDD